jgi:hypothetical protein
MGSSEVVEPEPRVVYHHQNHIEILRQNFAGVHQIEGAGQHQTEGPGQHRIEGPGQHRIERPGQHRTEGPGQVPEAGPLPHQTWEQPAVVAVPILRHLGRTGSEEPERQTLGSEILRTAQKEPEIQSRYSTRTP